MITMTQITFTDRLDSDTLWHLANIHDNRLGLGVIEAQVLRHKFWASSRMVARSSLRKA